ncbi:MAG: Rrf2 family transcriptional regulator [Lachnospiraceae bacterium]|nr:Rrf2 family transcriptional regulator [Lachnospiraceae bacterium]
MKISTKGRYALRIMIDLALYSRENCIPLKDISERQGITIKYMEQIMPLLTRAGYVKSFRGNNGGYKLAYEPKDYTVGQILRATEGSLSPITCIEDMPNQCTRYKECRTVQFWEGLRDVIHEYTDSVTLQDMIGSVEE